MPGNLSHVGMHWHAAALSDRGRVRPRNEDAYHADARTRLFAVADGMGGHAAGDVASRIAIETLRAAFVRAPSRLIHAPALARRLGTAFRAANDAILQYAHLHRETTGMGTTLTAFMPLTARPDAVIAHIGDSRAYRLRAGTLAQLTRDHTWVQQQVDTGALTPLQARKHPFSSVLTRVLGTAEVGTPDVYTVDVAPGDLFVLCSDGLTNMIDDLDLRTLLDRDLPLAQRAAQLVEAANLRGGYDNVTALLISADAA